MTTYAVLGDRAPVPCDVGDADGVAMAFMQKGTKVDPLPFRHPPLLDKEIRIRVTNAGLCHSDILTSTEGWGAHGNFPLVTGHEIVGIVEKLGEKVTKFQQGDRVGFGCFSGACDNCRLCHTGFDNLCDKRSLTYNPAFGGYSTSFQNNSEFFFKLYDEFPGESAPLFCAGATTFAPLLRHARPGTKVGIVGIGGLGHMGIKYANKFGCEVTAISSTASKRQEALDLGAHKFINSKDPEDLKKNARSLDLILDTASVLNLGVDSNLLKPRGSIVVVGVPEYGSDIGLNIAQIVVNQQQIYGSVVASRLEIEDLIEFTRINNVHPITQVYPFAETQAAVTSLAEGIPHYPKYRNVLETASFFTTFTPRF
jgi:D-arabinose 1-dehydrogenase-like Zn-dependent alcohol dehydrogenase